MSNFCCPPASWPSLQTWDEYKPKYEISPLPGSPDGLNAYIAPPSEPTTLGVIVVHDIFGVGDAHSRTHAVADHFAAEGYLAVAPEMFRGDAYPHAELAQFGAKGPEWAKRFPYEPNLKKDLGQTLAYLKVQGVKRVALLGFCWGGWFNFKASDGAHPEIVCAATCHPSVQLEGWVWTGDGDAGNAALASRVKIPQLLCPAGGDPEFVKEDGALVKIIRDNGVEVEVLTFPEMQHGWVNRGDVTQAPVKRDVQLALERVLAFFRKHLNEAKL